MQGSSQDQHGQSHSHFTSAKWHRRGETCWPQETIRCDICSNAVLLIFPQQNLPEPQIHAVASENLDLACSIIERVAMDKAVVDVDEGLGNAYMSRRRHREVSIE